MKSKVLDSKHMVKFHHNYEMARSFRFLQTGVKVNLSEKKLTIIQNRFSILPKNYAFSGVNLNKLGILLM